MKSTVLFFSLFVILMLCSCKNEDNPVPAPETETVEKLNQRATELFEQGTAVVDAAVTIKKEFTFEDKLLLNSLYDAGYSAGDVTKAIHIAYDYSPRIAEPILLEIMDNKTISDISELILKEYITELKSHPDDLKYFIGRIDGLEIKVIVLNEIYDKEPAFILTMLKDLGGDVTEIVQLLTNHFQLVEGDVKDMMLQTGCTVEEIARVLKVVYNSTAMEVFQFLNENGFQIGETFTVLKNLYNLSIVQIAQLLEGLNYETIDIAVILKDFQYTNKEIAVLLKNHFNYSAEETAVLLKQLNVSAGEITDILRDVYNLTMPEIVVILYDIGFSDEEILIVLSHHLEYQDIYDLYISLGFDPCIVKQFFHIPC